MKNNPLPRLDTDDEWRARLLPHCRLHVGDVWIDPIGKHRVGCLDATDARAIAKLVGDFRPTLAVQDPPYNHVAFEERGVDEYVKWSRQWVRNSFEVLADNSSFYVWLGADQTNGFQPLPDFMVMMRGEPFAPRSYITMRNQRGYGTQHNWMAVRQELLYYTKGKPNFNVQAEYTDIPKILRGYYKKVNGEVTENLERSNSENIRAGNVWVDIQQVFYRMEENVSGCYAQKPLKCIERIISASSAPGDVVLDLFAHSGSTLLASEIALRRCFTADIDPVYCEIVIRRLERYRHAGKLGWQNSHPFESEFPHMADHEIGKASALPRPAASLRRTMMQDLKKQLDALLGQLPDAAHIREANALVSVYPFNEYEYIISHLLGNDILTLDQYLELRDDYIARNMYLYIFEISGPRTFGESWAQGHLKELVPELSKSTKKLDPCYSGQYDFLLDAKIKIEVKASRGVDAELDAPLYVKALAFDSGRPFWMNFQQVKCGCCDVLVFISVWRDVIKYWVFSSDEVGCHPRYSKGQHRGNVGEGQLHITHENIHEFDRYAVPSNKLLEAIRSAYRRQMEKAK